MDKMAISGLLVNLASCTLNITTMGIGIPLEISLYLEAKSANLWSGVKQSNSIAGAQV